MADATVGCVTVPLAAVQPQFDEESELVRRAVAGDLTAFDVIVVRYEQRLYRFLVSTVHDAELARELCQDTFLSAYQALPKLRGDLHLSAWLHTIALNKARSHFRSAKLRPTCPIDEQRPPAGGDEFEDHVARNELVQRVLQRLPESYVQPLILQIASGLSCREIAQTLGSTEGAVKVRLLRAREAFRRAYEEEIQ